MFVNIFDWETKYYSNKLVQFENEIPSLTAEVAAKQLKHLRSELELDFLRFRGDAHYTTFQTNSLVKLTRLEKQYTSKFLGKEGLIKTSISKTILQGIRKNRKIVHKPNVPSLWEKFVAWITRFKIPKKRPWLGEILKAVNIYSNRLTTHERLYLNEIQRKYFPQQNKTKVGYELLEHAATANTLNHLPKESFAIDEKNYEVLDGSSIEEPFFVHATRMENCTPILSDLNKFYRNMIKICVSLFENGRTYFHANDIDTTDGFYVGLAMAIDPRSIYRNNPDDIGSPNFNRDPNIATKGGASERFVRSHIKANTLLPVVGAYLLDLTQRCYLDLPQQNDEEIRKNTLPAPLTNTQKIFRLERQISRLDNELHWNNKMTEDVKGSTEKALNNHFIRACKKRACEKKLLENKLQLLRNKTGHGYDLTQYNNGTVYNGRNIYNFAAQLTELKHLKGKLTHSLQLQQEIDAAVLAFNKIAALDPLRQFYSSIPKKLGMILHMILLSCIHIISHALSDRLSPYYRLNYSHHRVVPFFGVREVLYFQYKYFYNEFEVLSHDESKKIGARPIQIQFVTMSKVAWTALKSKIVNGDEQAKQHFQKMYEEIQKQGLKLVLVDTYTE